MIDAPVIITMRKIATNKYIFSKQNKRIISNSAFNKKVHNFNCAIIKYDRIVDPRKAEFMVSVEERLNSLKVMINCGSKRKKV